MYIYRKRPKNNLLKAQIDNAIKKKICPKCSQPCVSVRTNENVLTLYCPKCESTINFGNMTVDGLPKEKETQIGPFTVRDKSGQRQERKPQVKQDFAEAISIIREAFKQKKLLKFVYTGHNKQRGPREVEPYKLKLDGSGVPMLYGYCIEQDAIRLFKLEGMSSIELSDMEYKPKWPIEDALEQKDERGKA